MSRPPRANATAAPEALRPLLAEPAIAAVAALRPGFEALVVGGAVRDRLLGRSPSDFDAVVAGDGEDAADALAASLGVHWFRLGGERFAAYRFEAEHFRIDLFDRSPMSMEDDLLRRDFTVNSMALDLGNWRLIDPFSGREDLERRLVRATSDRSFEEDPLRVLRLVRFASRLDGFTVDAHTLELAQATVPLLPRSAAERIREELGLALERPAAAFRLLERLELYPSFWSGTSAREGLDEGIEERLERLELIARRLQESDFAVDRPLATQAVLFARLEGEALEEFRAHGYLSNRDARRIARLLQWTELPAADADRRWLLHSLGALWPTATAFLGSARAALGTHPELTLVELARAEGELIFAPPPLLDGHEIAEILGLEPGPRLGELVAGLRRAQIERRVVDREAATGWLRDQPASS